MNSLYLSILLKHYKSTCNLVHNKYVCSVLNMLYYAYLYLKLRSCISFFHNHASYCLSIIRHIAYRGPIGPSKASRSLLGKGKICVSDLKLKCVAMLLISLTSPVAGNKLFTHSLFSLSV